MNAWLLSLAVALPLAVAAGTAVALVPVKAGWQRGKGPLARWLDARRRLKFNLQLPEALATMSNALRAGFSISQAFDSVIELGDPPISEEFQIVQQQQRIGMSFEQALESLSSRVGSDDLTLVTTAILISRRTGGNVTEVFDRISETIRGRQKIERKVRTLTAQGRIQGIIVSAVPVFLAVVMTIIKPSMMIPYFLSPVGVISVLAVIVLITLGWLIIRKIIRIDV